jgi:pimeloyl-ACP methyl ester carboxylesterase
VKKDGSYFQRTVVAGDYEVRVLEKGAGEPLLFLHGAMGAGLWSAALDLLAEDFHVLAPDHPGFGPSPLPDWLRTMDDMVFHYLELLDALDPGGKPLLVGSSFGGWIAAELAAAHPERIRRLVLVDAAGLRLPQAPIPDVFRLSPESLLPLLFHDLSKAAPLIPNDLGPDTLVRLFHDRAALARLAWHPYMHDPKLPRRLRRLGAVPTLIVWGRQDRLLPPVYADEYVRLIPGAKVVLIENCGHDPLLEQPTEFARTAATFLKEP